MVTAFLKLLTEVAGILYMNVEETRPSSYFTHTQSKHCYSKYNGPIKCAELDHGSKKRNPQIRKAKRGKLYGCKT